MNVLVLGASGMIGRTMFRVLAQRQGWVVTGAVRSRQYQGAAPGPVLAGNDLCNPDHLFRLFMQARPEVVVNCAGLTKHLPEGNQLLPALTMNAMLPHRLAELCAIADARLIHVSTDCVFSGAVGNYRESDVPDAADVYGRTKALGEVTGERVLTLRTSTIGHEYGTAYGLLEWFLSQQECKGFRHAIFSGLPSVEFARLVRDVVIPNPTLSGLFHIAAAPIDKLSLLRLIASVYRKSTHIAEDDIFQIDRSLNSERFAQATGYRAAAWPELIEAMYKDYQSNRRQDV
jgi:dTDP-4-dehydrorhamnose reductase